MPQYNGVWTLEAQAQAQSNQQWVTDPNFKNTTLLLQADGTGSGSQNQTFLDGSTNNFFITRNGNTTQGSFSPFSQAPGYWSNYFNGSSYLTVPNNAALELNSVAFTIEAFVFLTSVATAQLIIGKRSTDGGTSYPISYLLSCQAGGVFKFETYGSGITNSTTLTSAAGVIQANVWNHVAITGDGTNIAAYVNGVRVVSPTASTLNTSTSLLYLGNFPVDNPWLTGYISNARIVKGTQLYSTATYTVPTSPLTAITNTVFLTSQSNRFVDNSTNAFAITLVGTPSVQAFGPFAPALQWTPTVVGGSGYFDGSDYLATTTTAVASGSTALQLEGWVYPTAITGSSTIFGGISNGIELQYDTTNISFNKAGVSNILIPSTPPIKNAWNHILACRNTSGVVSIYLNGVRQATATGNTTTFSATTANIGGTSYVTGYLAGVRYINGSNIVDPTQTSFTLPTAPVTAVTNTVNLLNYTNAGIYDGKMANNLETVGNAQVATSPVKYGSGSMAFDGNGDYLVSYASNPGLLLGTAPFTIEFWFNTNSSTQYAQFIGNENGASGDNGFTILINVTSSTSGDIGVYRGATGLINSASGNYRNVGWVHLAFVRDGQGSRLYINGIQQGSTTASQATTDFNANGGFRWVIGANLRSTGRDYLGYLDDLRVTNGVARYFANFTPPQQALPRQ